MMQKVNDQIIHAFAVLPCALWSTSTKDPLLRSTTPAFSDKAAFVLDE
jgi:hypothetical protein